MSDCACRVQMHATHEHNGCVTLLNNAPLMTLYVTCRADNRACLRDWAWRCDTWHDLTALTPVRGSKIILRDLLSRIQKRQNMPLLTETKGCKWHTHKVIQCVHKHNDQTGRQHISSHFRFSWRLFQHERRDFWSSSWSPDGLLSAYQWEFGREIFVGYSSAIVLLGKRADSKL